MLPELYHAHHNRNLEDLPFWLNLAEQSKGTLLELGCGTGRLTLPLAAAGHRVVGIDNSLPALCFARHVIGDIVPLPWLVAADIRKFHLAVRFSLVILPCNTYSTLDHDERSACLEYVHMHLSPGGRFAFSIPNPAYLRGLPTCSLPELEDEFLLPSSGDPLQVSSAWQRTRRMFMVTWTYDHLLPDGRVERTSETVAHHLASTEDYLSEIRSAGFAVSDRYGDFDGSSYHNGSPSLVCICSA